jgi:hypothetical protein
VKVLIFGSTGMVGQGVLRECLLDSAVTKVLVINRSTCGVKNSKLEEILQPEPTNISSLSKKLAEYDACFFCLGVSSVGMTEESYKHVSYDFTMDAAKVLVQANSAMTFVYVSGQGTDSSEKGRIMWARVKGKTENDLLKMPFKGKYMFRPGFIQPMHGEVSKVGWYNSIYQFMKPVYPLLHKVLPGQTTSTEAVARAMLVVAKQGSDKKVLSNEDINRLSSIS